MSTLFIILLLVSLVALVVGVAKPSLVKMPSRKLAGGVFGGAFVVFFILVAITSPQTPQTQNTVATSATTTASQQQTVSTTNTAPSTEPSMPHTQTAATVQQPAPTPKTTATVVSTPVSQPSPAPVEQTTPPPVPQPSVLMSLSGSGTKSTQNFSPSGDWTLAYTYDCSSFGSRGNFQVYIFNSDGSMTEFDGPNELGMSGSDTEYYHQGGTFYLEVNSECSWTVQVKG